MIRKLILGKVVLLCWFAGAAIALYDNKYMGLAIMLLSTIALMGWVITMFEPKR
jgi:hypothetical protein